MSEVSSDSDYVELTSESARLVLEEGFSKNVENLMKAREPIARKPGEIYSLLGKWWASTLGALRGLPADEKHVPSDGGSTEGDLKDIVVGVLDRIFRDYRPRYKVPGGGPARTLLKKFSSVEAAFGKQITYLSLIASAAPPGLIPPAREEVAYPEPVAASDPALVAIATAMQAITARLGALEQRTTAPPVAPPMVVHEAGATVGDPETEDLLAVLTGRMNAGSGTATGTKQGNGLGGGPGLPLGTAAAAGAVSPALTRAAHRLLTVGCPGLRVERQGAVLAQHMLQSEETFSRWSEAKKMNGAPLREAMTIGRSLDLGVQQYGAGFLASDPAEVLIRRLLSLALAQKSGSYRMAGVLEEVPGDGCLTELPDAFVKVMSERMKLEAKLEALARDGPKKQ